MKRRPQQREESQSLQKQKNKNLILCLSESSQIPVEAFAPLLRSCAIAAKSVFVLFLKSYGESDQITVNIFRCNLPASAIN